MHNRIYQVRKALTGLVFTLTNLIFICWLSYIIFTLYTNTPSDIIFRLPRSWVQFIFAFGTLCFLLILYKGSRLDMVLSLIQSRFFPLGLFILALIPRVAWVFQAGDLDLFSDYKLYMEISSSIAGSGRLPESEIWYITFAPYILGYSSLLALLFKVFGVDVLVAVLANAVFSSLIVAFLFLIGKRISGRPEVGIIAAALMLVFPAQIAMTIFPGTELPYILLLMIVIYVCLLIPNRRVQKLAFLLVISLAVLIIIMNEIRPLGILAIASFIIFFMLTNRFTPQTVFHKGGLLILILVLYGIATSVSASIKDHFVGTPIVRNAYGFGLALGMNYDTLGHWNPEDSALGRSAISQGKTAQEFNQQMRELAYQRFIGLVQRNLFFDLVIKKTEIFWSNPNVFIGWTPQVIEETYTSDRILEIAHPLSKGIYSLVIFLCLVESVLAFRRKDYTYKSRTFLIKIMLMLMLAMQAVYELNPRYISPAIPLFFLLAANGFCLGSRVVLQIKGALKNQVLTPN